MTTYQRSLPTALVLGAALALGACDRGERSREQPRVDPSVAAADKRADELRADASRAMGKAKHDAEGLANRAGEAIGDATITATVNAALATDAKLSALKIDVDTQNGVVTLNGPAPDDASRQRATQLAANVKGVTRVENRLAVAGDAKR